MPRARICRDGCLQLALPPEPIWTDAKGRFEIHGLPPGTQRIRIEAQGFAPAERAVNLMRTRGGSGFSLRGLQIGLERASPAGTAARIRGVALDGSGAPLIDHVVQLCAESALVSPTTHTAFDVVGSTRTDGRGRFELPTEGAGKHRLDLLSRSARPGQAQVVLASASVPAGRDRSAVELRARSAPLGAIRGRVARLPGQDLSHARITLRSAGLTSSLVLRPDPVTGAFECEAIPSGAVHVGLWTPGFYQPSLFAVEPYGPWTDVGVIGGETAGSIRLDLVAVPGVDRKGLYLSLRYEQGGRVRLDQGISTEGGEILDGAAWFPRVPPGKHRIVLGGDTLARKVVPIEVSAGEAVRSAVQLEPGIECRLSWPPELLGPAAITVRGAEGDEIFRAQARPTVAGLHAVEVPLLPGSYVATLLCDGEALEVPFHVEPAALLEGLDVALVR